MLILLDRDGVLNDERADFVKNPDQLHMITGSAEAVARLGAAGHRLVVVTNQSCIGRGIIDDEMLGRIHERLRAEIATAGGRLDDILYCPDPPWTPTERRKPGPGMLREALARYGGAAAESTMIGDSLRDLQAAATLGCRRVLVRTGNGTATQAAGLPPEVMPVAVHQNLAAAADAIIGATP